MRRLILYLALRNVSGSKNSIMKIIIEMLEKGNEYTNKKSPNINLRKLLKQNMKRVFNLLFQE
jgi:hypothetical protein